MPLNLEIGFAPYGAVDSVALATARFKLGDVARSRGLARASRYESRSTLTGDLVNSDWDYAIRRLGIDEPDRALGINSYIAIDSMLVDGAEEPNPRPFIGNRVKRGEPVLPRLTGLRCTQLSLSAVRRLALKELLLIDLHRARGLKTTELVKAIVSSRPADRPTILLAENASDVSRFVESPLCKGVKLSIATDSSPPRCESVVISLNRERIQYQQQFATSLPVEDLTDDELELSHLARAAWAGIWNRMTDNVGQVSYYSRFLHRLSEIQRKSPSSASRFNFAVALLQEAPVRSAKGVIDRRNAVRDCMIELFASGYQRIAVIVGNGTEYEIVRGIAQGLGIDSRDVLLGTARHFADSMELCEACVISGYYGPSVIDSVFRLRTESAKWVLDPIEASGAFANAMDHAHSLTRLGLDGPAAITYALSESLRSSAAHVAPGAVEMSTTFLSEPIRVGSIPQLSGEQSVFTEPHVDIYLSDGSDLIVPAANRFDVVRAGAAHPHVVRASDLQEGDQILLVRGQHQRTLAELLVQDMDSSELRVEAEKRSAWITLCRAVASRKRLTPPKISKLLHQENQRATAESVRSWLRDDSDARTPNNWPTFLTFAKTVGVDLPESIIREFYDAIRKWRIGHRKRGRDVVRLLRSAWFGGLSASDLSEVERKWGLGVRDLIEGSRVVEVEYTKPLPVGV